MKVKNTLRVIDNSQTILGILGMSTAILITMRAKQAYLLVLELSVGGTGVLIFIFRSALVNRVLKKSAHPGLLYALLEKLGYTDKLDLYLPDELLDEIYRPAYSTAEFLAEEDLPTSFGPELEFTPQSLRMGDNIVPWTSIYDWNFSQEGRNKRAKILVNYYDAQGNILEDWIATDFGRNGIDVMLMLTHFKGKYGQLKPSP